MKKFAIVMLAVAMSGLLVAAAPKPANVSGEWTLTVTTPRGDRTNTVTFVQDGEKLTVTMKNDRGEAKGEGTVKADVIEWTVIRQSPRGEMKTTYTGKITDDSNMSGQAEGNMGTMAWKAVKKAA